MEKLSRSELVKQANNLLKQHGFWKNQNSQQHYFERHLILTPQGGKRRYGVGHRHP